ncbi:MAG: aldolase/citrate lyase family protein [Ignisphaera sp.]|uniref:HpcH/HpaI aldolase/citrate lyase domain-containing protein n=1 Tax=Ignisphaera aggregans TaxID=334771 RepID=A0A7C4NKT0_9CREN
MSKNLKRKLKNKELTLGTWITIAHPDVVEVLSTLPLDWMVFDLEHAPIDISTLEVLLMGVRNPDIATITRVPWNDMVFIKRVLDVGSTGIMVPWVNSRSEAENVVRYARYPPAGIRGVGPRRCILYGARDFLNYYRYFEAEELVISVQIETKESIENVEDIAATDGIDVLFVGPMDLTVNLGIPMQYDHPKYIEALQRIVKACQKYDKVSGIYAFDVDFAKKHIAMGFRFVSLMSDTSILRSSMDKIIKEIEL